MSDKRSIRITVDKTGTYKFEAMEGFSGESCIEKTKNVELILGGTKITEGKKDSFYDGDAPENVFNSLM